MHIHSFLINAANYEFWLLIDGLFPILILVHLLVAPYSKVEEAFNLEAIHDILRYGLSRDAIEHHYDHVAFPGPVPRTFLGAFALAGLSKPCTSWLNNSLDVQILVRAILGLYNAAALVYFRRCVTASFGHSAGIWFALLQTSQFHALFYASRTLPNSFAYGLSVIALANFLLVKSSSNRDGSCSKRLHISIYFMTAACVIFRSELAILLGAEVLLLLARGKAYLWQDIITAGLVGASFSLCLTVSIDSYFWGRFPLWPEWMAFYFNVVEGKSSAWGTSPWYFYFFDALPRLLLNPLSYVICIPMAIAAKATRQRCIDLLIPPLAFICLYSCLPHKEWRFIVYAVPPLTAAAAVGASWIWTRRIKSNIYLILSVGLITSVIASFSISSIMLTLSASNYPGGQALTRLHEIANVSTGAVRVHIDNLGYQTGAVHFVEIGLPLNKSDDDVGNHADTVWAYDKRDDPTLLADPAYWNNFDYALAEYPEDVLGSSWTPVQAVYAFAGIGFGKGKGSGEEEVVVVEEEDKKKTTTMMMMMMTMEGKEGEEIGLMSYVLSKMWIPGRWRLCSYVNFVERLLLEKSILKARLPVVKMKPRIWILRNDRD